MLESAGAVFLSLAAACAALLSVRSRSRIARDTWFLAVPALLGVAAVERSDLHQRVAARLEAASPGMFPLGRADDLLLAATLVVAASVLIAMRGDLGLRRGTGVALLCAGILAVAALLQDAGKMVPAVGPGREELVEVAGEGLIALGLAFQLVLGPAGGAGAHRRATGAAT